MYNVQCILYTIQCTLYKVKCTLYHVYLHCKMQVHMYNIYRNTDINRELYKIQAVALSTANAQVTPIICNRASRLSRALLCACAPPLSQLYQSIHGIIWLYVQCTTYKVQHRTTCPNVHYFPLYTLFTLYYIISRIILWGVTVFTWCTAYIVRRILYDVHCTTYIVRRIEYWVYWTLMYLHIECGVHSTPCIIRRTLYDTEHCTTYNVRWCFTFKIRRTKYDVHCTLTYLLIEHVVHCIRRAVYIVVVRCTMYIPVLHSTIINVNVRFTVVVVHVANPCLI